MDFKNYSRIWESAMMKILLSGSYRGSCERRPVGNYRKTSSWTGLPLRGNRHYHLFYNYIAIFIFYDYRIQTKSTLLYGCTTLPSYRCASLDKIKAKAVEWKRQIRTSEQSYKQFYNYVFDYLREDKTVLGIVYVSNNLLLLLLPPLRLPIHSCSLIPFYTSLQHFISLALIDIQRWNRLSLLGILYWRRRGGQCLAILWISWR